MSKRFSDEDRRAVYDVIAKRRDIRHFVAGAALPRATLLRVLEAAHHAPSVGYSQPWDFVIVRDLQKRARIRESFLRVRLAEASRFADAARRAQYLSFKLEGIVDSTLNVCVTADLRPADQAVLGTTAQPESLRASALLAVQNLWLAARAEGVGVGWVSIVEPAVLRRELALPAGVEPVAYLCLGEPVEFRDRPLLEEAGWRGRRPVDRAIHEERFPVPPAIASPPAAKTEPAPLAFDAARAEAARQHQLQLCKPKGALGRLEEIAIWYAGARGQFPVAAPRAVELFVFAGDHGVSAEGVSAWPSTVTAAMVANMLAGGAAVCQLADAAGVAVRVVDVGVAGDLSSLPDERARRARFIAENVRPGTANFAVEPAMSRAELEAALLVGRRLADAACDAGCDLLCAGEMGIGNSTSAAALLCALGGAAPDNAVGRGAGLDDAGVRRKRDVIARALALHAPSLADPLAALAALGGLEIAAMTGMMLAGAARRVPVVVDGFIGGAAALAAVRLEPRVKDFLLASHRSAERGASLLLAALGLQPLLDLGMRLGEGTGAVLAAELLRHAVRLQADMATFSTAGIADRLKTTS